MRVKLKSTSCQHTQNPDLHPILRTRRRGQLASQMAKTRAVVGATGEILMRHHLYRERVYVKVWGSPSAFGLWPLIMFQLFMALRWISAKPRVNFTKSNFTKRLQPWFCECVLEKDRKLFWSVETEMNDCVECETGWNCVYQIIPFTAILHFLFGIIELK